MKLVLSVSGGGALGIGPLQFMRRLEEDLGAKLGDVCEAFAGTSTGSIIVSGLCAGMTADALYKVYEENLPAIFKPRRGTIPPILRPNYYRYDNTGLIKLLERFFPGGMGKFKKPIFIPTTFMNGMSVEKVWDRSDRRVSRAFAILSSCSAPTYFDTENLGDNIFCDGGMWANDPIMVLESGVKRLCKRDETYKELFADGFKILTFNTGMIRPNRAPEKKSAVGWLSYIMDEWVARTGNSNYFEACANIGVENVFRCAPVVRKAYGMDDLKVTKEIADIWDKYYDKVKKLVLDFVKSTM